MTILLAILIEILSVVGSSVIALKGATDALLQIPENGYKLDMDALQKYQQEYSQNNDKNKRNLAKILLFTPGVNLIFMTFNSYKFKRNVMTDETVRKTLIPMTDDEKEEYAKIDNYFEKVMFTLTSEKDAIIRKNSSGIQVGTAAIYHEALSEVYTVEEINIPEGYTATYKNDEYTYTVTNTDKLPQTGQLKWPILILSITGMLFIIVGIYEMKRETNEE